MPCFFGLWLIGYYTFCSQQHARDRSCIFQRYAAYFCRVNNTCSQHVLILLCAGVETEVGFAFLHFLYHDRTFYAGVGHYLPLRIDIVANRALAVQHPRLAAGHR